MRFLVVFAEKAVLLGSMNVRPARINGLPGFVVTDPEGHTTTATPDIAGEVVTAIYIVTDPDKMRHVAA